MKREKPTRCNNWMFIIKFCLNMFRASLCLSSGERKALLLHLVYCSGSAVCGVLTSYKTAPHNRYQPHPAEPEQHTKCSNRDFVLLKMGIVMPETC